MSEAVNLVERVRDHVARVFPGRPLALERPSGSMVVNLPELAVLELGPGSDAGAAWLYVTAGAGAAPMEDGYGIEFALLSAKREPLAARLVALVANLHGDPRYPMSLGQVLEIGQPWLPGATADHLLVALPTLLGPEFEWCSARDLTLRFAWLVPITKREAGLAKSLGYEALQERLGAAQVDVTALVRDSVV